jgi:hypothetical protein
MRGKRFCPQRSEDRAIAALPTRRLSRTLAHPSVVFAELRAEVGHLRGWEAAGVCPKQL